MSLNLTRHIEVTRLIAEAETVAGELTPNELELLRHLKAKYSEPGPGADDDRVCLEVMLRNVKIRESYAMDPKRDSGRVIEVTRRRGKD